MTRSYIVGTTPTRGSAPPRQSPYPPRFTPEQREEIRRLTTEMEELVSHMDKGWKFLEQCQETNDPRHDRALIRWQTLNATYMATHAEMDRIICVVPGGKKYFCPACRLEKEEPMTPAAILAYGLPCAEHAKPILYARVQAQQ